MGDSTGAIRLKVWEGAIDQMKRGSSYHLENLKVKVFDDIKYINTTEYTKTSVIPDMEISEVEIPAIEEGQNHWLT